MNKIIECECGCGATFPEKSRKSYIRRFVLGHSARVTAVAKMIQSSQAKEKICPGCGMLKPVAEFRLRMYRSKVTGLPYKKPRSRCRICEGEDNKKREMMGGVSKAQYSKNRRTLHNGEIKHAIQGRMSNWRRSDPFSDLTTAYLIDLYDRQAGLCYYTGQPMYVGTDGTGKIRVDTLSLDKLNPKKGYVKGNVVWCCYLVNTMKHRKTEAEFYAFLRLILTHKGQFFT